ncbi:casein kinase 1-like protein HD16 isoform X2 [Syzygium oleosum]|uniref:casein kinase 1-like protein HD16 isoform X2 n=1 Tax=Syzygium oleosum TaxID=219896 RepID=UPI0024BB0A67|nr:casein kinase 1-like protein HD16 isoform X2 [Syzygium oleosum]
MAMQFQSGRDHIKEKMATEDSDLDSRIGDEGLQSRTQGNLPPIPEEVQVGDSLVYRIKETLGKGSSGQVCVGQPVGPSAAIGQIGLGAVEVAIKFELRKAHKGREDGIPPEWKAYDDLGNDHGISLPRVHYKEQQRDYNVMVMDLLGQNLHVLMQNSPDNRLAVVACVAVEAISILEKLHSKGYIHGDIKPGNFLLGPPGTPEDKKLYLTDLGLARRWLDNSTGSHVKYDQTPSCFRGTTWFASVHAHLGRTSSRRDDLESLAYMLVKFISGRLPWQEYKGRDSSLLACKQKMATPPGTLCHNCPEPFLRFAELVFSLKFDEEPNYTRYISLFHGSIGPNLYIWPFSRLHVAQEVANKGVPLAEEDKLQVRTGLSVSQWIVNYDAHLPMKQRFYTNAHDLNLPLEAEKVCVNGMFVSSVAFCSNSWTLIMDNGTGFTAQTRYLSPEFLPQEWIQAHWLKSYQITAIAGADDHRSYVVMSKGTRYLRQHLEVSATFPFEWIKRQWAEGFHVTAMASSGSKWAVVTSNGAGFSHQVVEIDFQYPAEGILERQKQGYHITSVAASSDQIAFVFSITGEAPASVKQETLLTSNFPVSGTQEMWARDYYISSMCYSRTLS